MIKEQVPIQKEQPVNTYILQLSWNFKKRMEEIIQLNICKINIFKNLRKEGGDKEKDGRGGLSDGPAAKAFLLLQEGCSAQNLH